MFNIQFHSDDGYNPHAAVNVKVYHPRGSKIEKIFPFYERIGWTRDRFDEYCQIVFDNITRVFWQSEAQEIAKKYGFDGVFSEGRSDGWAAPFPYVKEEDLADKNLLKRFIAFQNDVKEMVDSVPESIYLDLRDNFLEEENEFLRRHSVAVRVLIHERVNHASIR